MTLRVKLCGITTVRDRDAAVAAGADALGFVVDVPVETPREVSVARAADLIAGAPPFVTTVAVTMPDSAAAAVDLLQRTGADAVQVHGDVPPADVATIAETGATVVRAVDASAPADARHYADVADALLVDTARESGAGGTGRTHDWSATRDLRDAVAAPVVLAGGLTPENVAEAVRTVRPYAVDVASGVEAAGGRKDRDRMRSFVARARRAAEAVPS